MNLKLLYSLIIGLMAVFKRIALAVMLMSLTKTGEGGSLGFVQPQSVKR